MRHDECVLVIGLDSLLKSRMRPGRLFGVRRERGGSRGESPKTTRTGAVYGVSECVPFCVQNVSGVERIADNYCLVIKEFSDCPGSSKLLVTGKAPGRTAINLETLPSPPGPRQKRPAVEG